MRASDYINHRLRNTINANLGRKIFIPEPAWTITPIRRCRLKIKQKKKQTLYLEEYKRIKRNPKPYLKFRGQYNKRVYSTLSKVANSLKDAFYQPAYDVIKYEFVDMPDILKENFKALTDYNKQIIISTDKPPNCTHFQRIEDAYLTYLKDSGDNLPLPSEKIREALAFSLQAGYSVCTYQGSIAGKIEFYNGLEMITLNPDTDEGTSLSTDKILTDDDIIEE